MQAAVTKNCQAVLEHAVVRKAYKGAVLVEPVKDQQHQSIDNHHKSQQQGILLQQQGLAGQPGLQIGRDQVVKVHSADKGSMLPTSKQRKRKSR